MTRENMTNNPPEAIGTINGLTPLHTANFIKMLADAHKMKITPMQLIKLTYIAYAWCLCKHNKRIFSEPIEAWDYGPVIPSLYHEFKKYGAKPVAEAGFNAIYSTDGRLRDIKIPSLDIHGSEITDTVIDAFRQYKDYSGIQLSALTHEDGSPWDKARRTGKSNVPIQDRDIIERCQSIIK